MKICMHFVCPANTSASIYAVDRNRKITVATYYGVEEEECAALVNRFAEANKIDRRDLFGLWTRSVAI